MSQRRFTDPSAWLTTAELAAVLRVTDSAAWAWARRMTAHGFPARRSFRKGRAKVSCWSAADAFRWFQDRANHRHLPHRKPPVSVGTRQAAATVALATIPAAGPSPAYLAELRDSLRVALDNPGVADVFKVQIRELLDQ